MPAFFVPSPCSSPPRVTARAVTRSQTAKSDSVAQLFVLDSFDVDATRAAHSRASSPIPPLAVEEERIRGLQQVNRWRSVEFARLQDEVKALRQENAELLAHAAHRSDAHAQVAADNSGALRAGLEYTLGLLWFLLVCDRELAKQLFDRMPRRAWLYAFCGGVEQSGGNLIRGSVSNPPPLFRLPPEIRKSVKSLIFLHFEVPSTPQVVPEAALIKPCP